MKKLYIIIAAVLASATAFGQSDARKAAEQAAAAFAGTPVAEAPAEKPTYWTNTLVTNVNLLQKAYTNWAKGGFNNISMSGLINGNADYAKDKTTWKNHLQFDYAFLYSEDKPIMQKTQDRMLFESTYGLKATNTLSYSAKFIFTNQFSKGYTYGTPSADNPSKTDWKNARALKSDFLSPAIITLGFGIDWVPTKWLTVNFAPLTGGLTIVKEESLRKNYGMELKKEYENEASPLGSYYRPARFDFGAQLTADAKIKVNDNFDATTRLVLFSNYLNNPQNLRVNWDNIIAWKLAKFFALTLTTNLIYDDTVLIVDTDHPAGHKAIQFYEALQFGFTYTFASKK